MPLVSFYTPWKYEKTSRFLIFSGGIERDQWHEMGYADCLVVAMITQACPDNIYLFKVKNKKH